MMEKAYESSRDGHANAIHNCLKLSKDCPFSILQIQDYNKTQYKLLDFDATQFQHLNYSPIDTINDPNVHDIKTEEKYVDNSNQSKICRKYTKANNTNIEKNKKYIMPSSNYMKVVKYFKLNKSIQVKKKDLKYLIKFNNQSIIFTQNDLNNIYNIMFSKQPIKKRDNIHAINNMKLVYDNLNSRQKNKLSDSFKKSMFKIK